MKRCTPSCVKKFFEVEQLRFACVSIGEFSFWPISFEDQIYFERNLAGSLTTLPTSPKVRCTCRALELHFLTLESRACWPFLRTIYARHKRHQMFPVLFRWKTNETSSPDFWASLDSPLNVVWKNCDLKMLPFFTVLDHVRSVTFIQTDWFPRFGTLSLGELEFDFLQVFCHYNALVTLVFQRDIQMVWDILPADTVWSTW